MLKRIRLFKIISVLLLVVFVHEQIGWTQEGRPVWTDLENVSNINSGTLPSEIKIPYDIGQVSDAAVNGTGEVIINIQDAHASLSSQHSIVDILDTLVSNYDVKFIGLEGAEGYIDTSVLRTFPDKKIRRETAEFLMREGRLSAGEFFDATRDKNDVVLYGVEDNELYNKNVESFREIMDERAVYAEEVAALRKQLGSLSGRVFSPRLKTLLERSRLHREGRMSFSDYWEEVKEIAASGDVSHDDLVNMKKLLRSIEMEEDIDFAGANLQRKQLIGALSDTMDRKDIEELVLRSLLFKQNKVSQADFHGYLIRLAASYGIGTGGYEHLVKFTEYVSLYESIDIMSLFREVSELEERMKEALYRNGDERELAGWMKLVELLGNLYNVELSNEDCLYIMEHRKDCDGPECAKFIKKVCLKYNVQIEGGYDTGRVFGGVEDALEFYKVAESRNDALLKNTLGRMRTEGKKVAALITGGFHTSGLTKLMRDNKLSYLVIAPKFEKGKERPYIAVLTNKKKPYQKLIESGKYNLAVKAYFEDMNEDKFVGAAVYALSNVVKEGGNWKHEAARWHRQYSEEYERRKAESEDKVKGSLSPEEFARILGVGDFEGQGQLRIESWEGTVMVARVKDDESTYFRLDRGEGGVLESPRVLSPRQGRKILAALDQVKGKRRGTLFARRVSGLERKMDRMERELAAVLEDQASYLGLAERLGTDKSLLCDVVNRFKDSDAVDTEEVATKLKATADFGMPGDWKSSPDLRAAVEAFTGLVNDTIARIRDIEERLGSDEKLVKFAALFFLRTAQDLTAGNMADFLKNDMKEPLFEHWESISELNTSVQNFTKWVGSVTPGVKDELKRRYRWEKGDMERYDNTLTLFNMLWRHMSFEEGEESIGGILEEISGSEENPVRILEVGSGTQHPITDYFRGKISIDMADLDSDKREFMVAYERGFPNVTAEAVDPRLFNEPDKGMYQGNALKMDMFGDASFDHLFAFQVFNPECYSEYRSINKEFWEDNFPGELMNEEKFYKKIADEFYRILKPGGKIFMSTGVTHNDIFNRILREAGFEYEYIGYSLGFGVFKKPSGKEVSLENKKRLAKRTVSRINGYLTRCINIIQRSLNELPMEGELDQRHIMALERVQMTTQNMIDELRGDDLYVPYVREVKEMLAKDTPGSVLFIPQILSTMNMTAQLVANRETMQEKYYLAIARDLDRLKRIQYILSMVTVEDISFFHSAKHNTDYANLRNWQKDPPLHYREWLSYLFSMNHEDLLDRAQGDKEVQEAFDKYVPSANVFSQMVRSGEIAAEPGEEEMFERAKGFLLITDPDTIREVGSFARLKVAKRYMEKKAVRERKKGPGGSLFGGALLFALFVSGLLTVLMQGTAAAATSGTEASGGMFLSAGTVLILVAFVVAAASISYVSGFVGRRSESRPFRKSLLRSSVIGIIAFVVFFFTFNIAEMRFPRSVGDLLRTPVANAKQIMNGFLSEEPRARIANGLEHSLVSINGIPGEVMWADSVTRMEVVPYSLLAGYVPPAGYKVYGVFNTAPQADGKHTTFVGGNGQVFRSRNKVSTRAGGAFYIRYPDGTVRIVRNTDEAYRRYVAGKHFEVAVQAGPLLKEAGKISDNLPKEATSRLYVGVDPATKRTKIIHVGSGMTGYSDVRGVLEEHFEGFPEVMLFDAGQFDVSAMDRGGISGKPLRGDNVFCLVVMARALSERAPFAGPEWRKTPFYVAIFSGVLGIIAPFVFSDNIAALVSLSLAALTSLYALAFALWKHAVLGSIREGGFQSDEYWDAPNTVVRERVMTLFGELSRALAGGHVGRKHARELAGSKIDVLKGPSEVVLVGKESPDEVKEMLGDDYAVFDKDKNVLYILGTLARAPDWVLSIILSHEAAHHFTKSEFRANLFAAYNLRKTLRTARDLPYTREDYRIATVTKNRATREQSVRKSRLAVLIADRMKKEGYDITDSDIEILRKVFLVHAAGGSDAEHTLAILDEEEVDLTGVGRELIRYYHSYSAFNDHFNHVASTDPGSLEVLMNVKKLLPIVRLVDQFEEDQDRMGMVITASEPDVTFHHTFKILQDVYDEEGIYDRRAYSVFRKMMGEEDTRILNLIAESRRTNKLTVSDHVLMKISNPKEKTLALRRGLIRDPGNDEHAVMMFSMGLSERLKKRMIRYLEGKGFDVARVERKRGRIGMSNVLGYWGMGGVIEDAVKELAEDGFAVFRAKVALVQNDGEAFEDWFSRIEGQEPRHPAVRKLRYWIDTFNRGVETVIVRSRAPRRTLVKEFNAPESALEIPFQDFFSEYVVGNKNVLRAEPETLRGRFIEPELDRRGELKKIFKAGEKTLPLTEVGLANGINCPAYAKLQGNMDSYLEIGWKRPEKASPAAIPSIRKILAPHMHLKDYAVKVAPWLEELVFFAVPMVISHFAFGIDSLWGAATMLAVRTVFFFLHKRPRELMSMTQEEILGLFNPSYGELRKHVYADLKYVVALAKAMGIEEGSEDMHMLRVIALTHDLGGVLGLRHDEQIEKNLFMEAMSKNVQYQGRDPNDVEADLIGRGVLLTADDRDIIPSMDHPNNSLRVLDSYGIKVPPVVRNIISRHMESPSEKDLAAWTERERRLFTCFAIADVFETGNNYYKQKQGYYKHEGKFEDPEDTMDFLKNVKFRNRPSIKAYLDKAEEFILAGGLEEAIEFSRTPIDQADMSIEIIPRAPPAGRPIPLLVAAMGVGLAVLPVVVPVFAAAPYLFISGSAVYLAVFHLTANILAVIKEIMPATVQQGEEIPDQWQGLSPSAKEVFLNIARRDMFLEEAMEGKLTLERYQRRFDEDDPQQIAEGFKDLVDKGYFQVTEDTEDKVEYGLTDKGQSLILPAIESIIVSWINGMRTGDLEWRREHIREASFGGMFKTAHSYKQPDPERIALLKKYSDEVLDVVMEQIKDEVRMFEAEKGNPSHLSAPLTVIENLLEKCRGSREYGLVEKIVEHLMMVPHSKHPRVRAAFQRFYMHVVAMDPERARTFLFYLITYFSEHGDAVKETDNPVFGIMDFLHKTGNENFYYFLRRIAAYTFRDHSGQVNVGPEHPLRCRTRCGTYGPDLEGVIRDSIHNHLGVYVLGLLERYLEYCYTGDHRVLGDQNYQVDAFKNDEFPSQDAVFPEATVELYAGPNPKDTYGLDRSNITREIFSQLEGDLGRELGIEGETKWEKLRNASDEQLQAIYDAVNAKHGSNLQAEYKGYAFSGYIFAYRELSRRYKRVASIDTLADNLYDLAARHGVANEAITGERWGKRDNPAFQAIRGDDPIAALERILESKKNIRKKVFSGTLSYDPDEVMERFELEWGRDDVGNAYGGAWVRDDMVGLYMADNVLTMIQNMHIENISKEFMEIDGSNIIKALKYLRLLAELSYAEGLISRSFMDHIDTLLQQEDLDISVARDVVRFMQQEFVEVRNYINQNTENYIHAMLDAEGIYGKKRDEEFGRRLNKLLNHDRVFRSARGLITKIAKYAETREGTFADKVTAASAVDEPRLFGGTVPEETIKNTASAGRYRLSSKGLELARTSSGGLPIPEGVIVPATVSDEDTGALADKGLKMLEDHLAGVEGFRGMKFGSPDDPLVVSVRSGAYIVMPGQMPTIANVGLCRDTIDGFTSQLVRRGVDPRDARWTAWDSYARFLQSYAVSVLGISEQLFIVQKQKVLQQEGAGSVRDLPLDKMKHIADRFETIIIEMATEEKLPRTAEEQFKYCVDAVKKSWAESTDYRDNVGIKGEWPGTAVIIQRMVFGNINKDSGVGVINSRMVNVRKLGLEGDFLWFGQGDDVAQHRAEELVQIQDIADDVPWKKDLEKYAELIETSLGTMAEIEFTVELGKVYILQVRDAYVDIRAPDYFFIPSEGDLLARRQRVIPASGGAYRGMVYVLHDRKPDMDEIDRLYEKSREAGGDGVIIVADDLGPEQLGKLIVRDEEGRLKIGGLITKRGGKLSHAGDIARNHRMAAIANVKDIAFQKPAKKKKSFLINDRRIAEGEMLSISGSTGVIYQGLLPLTVHEFIESDAQPTISYNYFVEHLKRRGQVLSVINQVLDAIQEKQDVNLLAYLRTIVDVHSEMLEKKAPYVFAVINAVLESGSIQVDQLREKVKTALEQKHGETAAGAVTKEMEETISRALASREFLEEFGLSPGDISEVVFMGESAESLQGRMAVNLVITVKRGSQEPETIPLRVALYKVGYDLDPDLLATNQTIASRLIDYLEEGLISRNEEMLYDAGIPPYIITESYAGAGDDRDVAIAVLASKLAELDVKYEDMERIVARIGAFNMESMYRLHKAMDKGFTRDRMVFKVLPKEGPYEAIKIRARKARPTVNDVLIRRRFSGREVNKSQLAGLKRQVAKVLLRAYDSRMDVYDTLANAFNLRERHAQMTFNEMRDQLSAIRADDLDEEKEKLLRDLLGIEGRAHVTEKVQEEFTKLGLLKRFPMNIKDYDLIVRPSAKRKMKVEVVSWGAFVRKADENEVIGYLHREMKIPFNSIFKAMVDLYGNDKTLDFLRIAYMHEPAETHLSRVLISQITKMTSVSSITVGLPRDRFNKLTPDDISKLDKASIVRIAILESDTREGMLEELEQARKRHGSVASVLVDEDTQAESRYMTSVILSFAKAVKNKVFILSHPDIVGLTPEAIAKIDDLPSLLKEISSDYLDVLEPFELSSISIYSMRVENSYWSVKNRDRMNYTPAALDDVKEHQLVHYADGETVLDTAKAIVPPGLEIARRRKRMRVDISTDRQNDRFMVMAPKNVVTDSEKAEFKKRLMELWMLEGLVSERDIVILDRREEGYTNSELFGMVKAVVPGADADNTGFRVIAGDLGYEDKSILQVNLAPEAASNFNQYEVFVNLLLTGKSGTLDDLAEVEIVEGRLYIYLPKARPVDFETEVRNYYEKYREVLIRA